MSNLPVFNPVKGRRGREDVRELGALYAFKGDSTLHAFKGDSTLYAYKGDSTLYAYKGDSTPLHITFGPPPNDTTLNTHFTLLNSTHTHMHR